MTDFDALGGAMRICAVVAGCFYGIVIAMKFVEGRSWRDAILSKELALAYAATVLMAICVVIRYYS